MPVTAAKTALCPVCDREVDVKRGKLAAHPAKVPAKGKATVVSCEGSGQPAPVATSDASPETEPTVVAPSLDVMVLEANRPEGAWAGAQAASLDPRLCDPDPNNPRKDLGDLTEMALSLVSSGMLEPVIVAPGPAEGRYTIVAGHRRIAAAVAAGLAEVPGLIRADLKPGSNLSLVAQVVENLHRLPLSPIEEARSYDLLRQLGMKQTDIATAVGVNQGQVSKRLALLKLPEELAAKVGADSGLDVATAVEVTRLPAAARADAIAQIDKGADAEQVVRRAKQTIDKDNAHQKIIDDLEARQVALVDFPTSWHWGRDREDRPLATGPDGERQPYGGARTIDIDYVDHAAEPCHGATVSDRDEVVYVCLDPTRHGYPTAEQEAAALDAERLAADEERERERALRDAAVAARRDAARIAATTETSRPTMTDVVAAWAVDRLAADARATNLDDLDPLDVLDRVVEWTGTPVPPLDELDEGQGGAVLVNLLLEQTTPLHLAYMAAIASVDLLLDGPAYYVDALAGSPIIRDHFARLIEVAGYSPSDAERLLIDPPAPEYLDTPDDVPTGAVAWYSPSRQAVLDGDEARFLYDVAEADAIRDAQVGGRLTMLEPPVASPDPEMTDEENASTSPEPSSEPADSTGDEDPIAAEYAEAMSAESALVDLPDDVPPLSPADVREHLGVVDTGDQPVPGELCPASRRSYNIAGDATGVECPVHCGALVSTTKSGKVRDHDVPSPEVVEA